MRARAKRSGRGVPYLMWGSPKSTTTTRAKCFYHLLSSNMSTSISRQHDTTGDQVPPDYMNERVFQRNRLPPRAYFLPPEHLSLSGKWRFHYASSPLEPEPELKDDDAWGLIDVPGKLLSKGSTSLSQGNLLSLCRDSRTVISISMCLDVNCSEPYKYILKKLSEHVRTVNF